MKIIIPDNKYHTLPSISQNGCNHDIGVVFESQREIIQGRKNDIIQSRSHHSTIFSQRDSFPVL